jgi:hypothetical protein
MGGFLHTGRRDYKIYKVREGRALVDVQNLQEYVKIYRKWLELKRCRYSGVYWGRTNKEKLRVAQNTGGEKWMGI